MMAEGVIVRKGNAVYSVGNTIGIAMDKTFGRLAEKQDDKRLKIKRKQKTEK